LRIEILSAKVVIAGGSGFIGQSLAKTFLSKDYEVVILTRSPSGQREGMSFVQWDGKSLGDWAQSLEGAVAVVNLTGKSINCRHTPENKREILESRLNSVRVIGEAITPCAQPPTAFVQASAVGIYGNAGGRWCDEETPPGDDFMADVCRQWENVFNAVTAPATRKVLLRVGIALGQNGGFLQPLNRFARLFLGGHLGSGKQFISWIHLGDLTRMFVSATERVEIAGVFNATAPNPATNAEFMRELRRAWHRPWSPPVPQWVVLVGAVLIGMEGSLAFYSQRCAPRNFLAQGFEFQFPELPAALREVVSRS
jgi:uncharacterized protein (TIGR01777 family)